MLPLLKQRPVSYACIIVTLFLLFVISRDPAPVRVPSHDPTLVSLMLKVQRDIAKAKDKTERHDLLQLAKYVMTDVAERARPNIDWLNIGHTGQYPKQNEYYIDVKNKNEVKQVCEVGFNAGHSAVNFLLGYPQADLLVFDLGELPWFSACSSFVQEVFGKRFQMVQGDSVAALPAFAQRNPDIKCDIVSIDGGHAGEIPELDLKNVLQYYVTKDTVILMDDETMPDIKRAIQTALSDGVVRKVECIDDNKFVGDYRKSWCQLTPILHRA